MTLEKLKYLYAQIPNSVLRHGYINNDKGKPGIFAGDAPVCRLPQGAIGGAYGALIVEVINNLPWLLNSIESTTPDAMNSRHLEQSAQIQEAISKVLCMRPGAQGALPIWSRLIWTSITAILEEGYVAAPATNDLPRSLPDPEEIRRIEREAVLKFTGYLLSQSYTKPIDGEEAIAAHFSDWERSCGAVSTE